MRQWDWYEVIKKEFRGACFIEAEDPEVEDAVVHITDRIKVQLADGGLCAVVVVKNKEGGFTFKPMRGNVKSIIKDIKEVMNV